MNKIVLKAANYVCGLCNAAQDPAKNPDLDLDINGSGFFLNKNFVITANHVVTEGTTFVLQALPERAFQYIKIDPTAIERFPKLDLCIVGLKASADEIGPLVFDEAELNMLDDVLTFGYPLAINDKRDREITTRAFKGYITATRNISKNKVYELSFQCPRMLSGPPLLQISTDGIVLLKGMILRNEIADFTVEETTTFEKNGAHEHTLKRVESYHRGIALQLASIAEVYSNLLNATIREAALNR